MPTTTLAELPSPPITIDILLLLGPPSNPILTLPEWEHYLQNTFSTVRDIFDIVFRFTNRQNHLLEILLVKIYPDNYIIKFLQHIYALINIHHPYYDIYSKYPSKLQKISLIFSPLISGSLISPYPPLAKPAPTPINLSGLEQSDLKHFAQVYLALSQINTTLTKSLTISFITHPTSQTIWSLILVNMKTIWSYGIVLDLFGIDLDWIRLGKHGDSRLNTCYKMGTMMNLDAKNDNFDDFFSRWLKTNDSLKFELPTKLTNLGDLGVLSHNLETLIQKSIYQSRCNNISSQLAHWVVENKLNIQFNFDNFLTNFQNNSEFFLLFPSTRYQMCMDYSLQQFGQAARLLKDRPKYVGIKNKDDQYVAVLGRTLGGDKHVGRDALVKNNTNNGKTINNNKNNYQNDENNHQNDNNFNEPQLTYFNNPYQYPYQLSKVFLPIKSSQAALENSNSRNVLVPLVKFIFSTISHYYGHLPFSRLIFTYIRPLSSSLPPEAKKAFDVVIENIENYFQKNEIELQNVLKNVSKKSSTYFLSLREKLHSTSISIIFEIILNLYLFFDPKLGIHFSLCISFLALSQVPQSDLFIFPYFCDYFPPLPSELYQTLTNMTMLNRNTIWDDVDELDSAVRSFEQDYYQEKLFDDCSDEFSTNSTESSQHFQNLTKIYHNRSSPSQKLTHLTEKLLTSLQTYTPLSITHFDSFLISIIQFSSDLITYPRHFSLPYKHFQLEFEYVLTNFSDYNAQLDYLESLLVQDQIEQIDTWVDPVVDKDGTVDIWGTLSDRKDTDANIQAYENKMSQRKQIIQEVGTVRVTQDIIDRFKAGMAYFSKASCYSLIQYLIAEQDIFDLDLLFTLLTNTHQHELYIMNRPYDFGSGVDKDNLNAVGLLKKNKDKKVGYRNSNKLLNSNHEYRNYDWQPSLNSNIGGQYLLSVLIQRQYPPQILNLYLRICEDNIFNVQNNQFYSRNCDHLGQYYDEKNHFYNLEDALSLTLLDYAIINQTYRNHSSLVSTFSCQLSLPNQLSQLLPRDGDDHHHHHSPNGKKHNKKQNSGKSFVKKDITNVEHKNTPFFNREGLDFTKNLIKGTNCAYIRPPIRSLVLDDEKNDKQNQKNQKNQKNRKNRKNQKNQNQKKENNDYPHSDIHQIRPDQRYLHRLLTTISYDQDIPAEMIQYLAKKTIRDNHILTNLIIDEKISKFQHLQKNDPNQFEFFQKKVIQIMQEKIQSKYIESHYILDNDIDDVDLIDNDLITWPYLYYLLDNVPSLYQNKSCQGFMFNLIETFLTLFLVPKKQSQENQEKIQKIQKTHQKQPQSLQDFAHFYQWDLSPSVIQSNPSNPRFDTYIYSNKNLILNQYDLIFLIYKLIALQFSPHYLEIIFSKFFCTDYLYQLYYFYVLPPTTLVQLPGSVVYADGEEMGSDLIDGIIAGEEQSQFEQNQIFGKTTFDAQFHAGVYLTFEEKSASHAIVYKHSFFPIHHKPPSHNNIPHITQDINPNDLKEITKLTTKTDPTNDNNNNNHNNNNNQKNYFSIEKPNLIQYNIDFVQNCFPQSELHKGLICDLFSVPTSTKPITLTHQGRDAPPRFVTTVTKSPDSLPIIAFPPNFSIQIFRGNIDQNENIKQNRQKKDFENAKTESANSIEYDSILEEIDPIRHNISPTIVDLVMNYTGLAQPAYLTLLFKYCHLEKMVGLNQLTPSLFCIGTTYFLKFLQNFVKTSTFCKRITDKTPTYNYKDVNTVNPLISLDNKSYTQIGHSFIQKLIPFFYSSPPPPQNHQNHQNPSKSPQNSPQPYPKSLSLILPIDQSDTINTLNINRISIPSILLFAHYINADFPISLFFQCCSPQSGLDPNLPMPFSQTPPARENFIDAKIDLHPYKVKSSEYDNKSDASNSSFRPNILNFLIQDVNPNRPFLTSEDAAYPIERAARYGIEGGHGVVEVGGDFGGQSDSKKDKNSNGKKGGEENGQGKLTPLVYHPYTDPVYDFHKPKFSTLPVMNLIHYMVFEAIWHANVPERVQDNVEQLHDLDNLKKTNEKVDTPEQIEKKALKKLKRLDVEPIHKPHHLIRNIIIPFVTCMGQKRTKNTVKYENDYNLVHQNKNKNNSSKNMLFINQLVSPPIFLYPAQFEGYKRPLRGHSLEINLMSALRGPSIYESGYTPNQDHFIRSDNILDPTKNDNKNCDKNTKRNLTEGGGEEDPELTPSPLFFKSHIPPANSPSIRHQTPFNSTPRTRCGSKFTVSLHLWHIILSGAINVPLELISFLVDYGLEFVYKYKYIPGHIQAQAFGPYLNCHHKGLRTIQHCFQEYTLHAKLHKEIEKIVDPKKDSTKIDKKAPIGKKTSKAQVEQKGLVQAARGFERSDCTESETNLFEMQKPLHHRLILGEIASIPVYHNFITQAMLLGYPFVGFLVQLSEKYPILSPNLPQFDQNFEKTQLYHSFLHINYHNPPKPPAAIYQPSAYPLLPSSKLRKVILDYKNPANLPGFDSLFYKFRLAIHVAYCNTLTEFTPRLFTPPLPHTSTYAAVGFTPLHSKYITPSDFPFVLVDDGSHHSQQYQTLAYSTDQAGDELRLKYFGRHSRSHLSIAALKAWFVLNEKYGLLMKPKLLQSKVSNMLGISADKKKWKGKNKENCQNRQNRQNRQNSGTNKDINRHNSIPNSKNNQSISQLMKGANNINTERSIDRWLNKMAKNIKTAQNVPKNTTIIDQDIKNSKQVGNSIGGSNPTNKAPAPGSVSMYLIGTEYDESEQIHDDDYYNDEIEDDQDEDYENQSDFDASNYYQDEDPSNYVLNEHHDEDYCD
jgi:hypothetical protein